MATTKNSGCRRSSQNRQPALNNPPTPRPARTCGSTHQLGVSKAAIIDRTPTGFGSALMGTTIKPLAHSVVNSAAAAKNLGHHYENNRCWLCDRRRPLDYVSEAADYGHGADHHSRQCRQPVARQCSSIAHERMVAAARSLFHGSCPESVWDDDRRSSRGNVGRSHRPPDGASLQHAVVRCTDSGNLYC